MIYSATNDNWQRVVLMHSLARDLYRQTEGSNFRDRMVSGGDTFPFDPTAYSTLENESRIVGMTMAWSVVTLESLANLQLASIINDKELAVLAIRWPKDTAKNLSIGKRKGSELGLKLMIIENQSGADATNAKTLATVADTLADQRNKIVHDKPFLLIDHGDGHVDFEEYSDSNATDRPILRYDDLDEWFMKCDSVAQGIVISGADTLHTDVDFASLNAG